MFYQCCSEASSIYCNSPKILPTNTLAWKGATVALYNDLSASKENKRYNLLLRAQKSPKGSPEWSAKKKKRIYCTKSLRYAELFHWKGKSSNAKSITKSFGMLSNYSRALTNRQSLVLLKIQLEHFQSIKVLKTECVQLLFYKCVFIFDQQDTTSRSIHYICKFHLWTYFNRSIICN